MQNEKKCNKCLQTKSISNFAKHSGRKSGYIEQCKQCKREYDRAHRTPEKNAQYKVSCYGITFAQYSAMVVSQNNKCAVCHKEEAAKFRGKKTMALAIDHCHKTGKVRGLLCSNCNTAMGKLKDNVATLESMIKYLGLHAKAI